MKVMLVDDEPGIRDQGKIFLEKFDPDFEVTSASSAILGMEKLFEEDFDIVVSDYQMPEVNGIEFLEKMREDGVQIPFIMFTGRGREEVAMKALNLGAQRYIKKGGGLKSQYWILGDAIKQEVIHFSVKNALKEKKRRYESFFKTIKDCAFITSKDGRWIEFNEAALDLFGYDDTEELKNVQIKNLYNDPVERKEVTSLIEEKGFAKDIPVDLVRKDGSVIHTKITSVVLKDEEDRVIGYQGTIRDISKEMKFEMDLERSKKDLTKILNSMTDSVFIHPLHDDFIFVNKAAIDHLGYSQEELMSMSPFDINKPDHTDKVKEWIDKIEEKEKFTFNSIHVTRSGKEIPVEISSKLVNFRGEEVILSVVRELSRQKKGMFDLDFYQRMCKPLFKKSLDGIYVHDLEGNFLDANRSALEMLGYSREEIENMNVKDLIVENSEEVFRNIEHIIETEGDVQHKIYHLRRKDGERITVETDGCLIYRGDEPYGIIGIARDVTERDNYERELKDTAEKLKDLHEYTIKMNSAEDFKKIYKYALKAAKNVLDFEDSTFMDVWDDEIKVILTTAENVKLGTTCQLSETVAGRAFSENKTIVVVDIDEYEGKYSASSDSYKSCIAVPIEDRGIFQVISDNAGAFDKFDKEMAELLALQLDTALKRKEEENKIKRSKKEYQAFIESANVGVGLNDKYRNITFVNNTLAQILGYRESELIGKNLSELIDKEEYELMCNRTKNRLVGKKENYDCKIKKKDGSHIYANVWASPLEDEDGKYIGDLGVIIDITDRKMIEQKLTRNHKAIEASIDGIAILDKEEHFVYLNDAHVDIYGYENAKELEGKSWKILYSGDERIRFENEIMPRFREEGYWRGEAVGTRKDGSQFDQEVTLTDIANGGMVCVVRDTTTRKEFERKLKETDMAFDSSVTGIALTDINRSLTRVNSTLLSMWGYDDAEEVLGKDAIHFFKDKENNLEKFENFFSEGWMNDEMIAVRKDGSEFTVQITANLIEDENGDPIGIFASLMDITERKKFEDREEFLHSLLRHDLKNKIQIAAGYIQLLEDTDLLDTQGKDWMLKSKDSLLESLDLISKVKELKEVNKELDTFKVNIKRILDESINQQRSLAETLGVKISFEGKSIDVVGGKLLDELFINIIENSLVHSQCNFIDISMVEKKASLVVIIEDDGIGISDDDKKKIFDKGFKGEGSKGSGLGMCLVKRILGNYDGDIKVADSELGGARFEVILNKA